MSENIITESKESRNWALLCHLSSLSGFIGVPFGNILGPLILWLIKKEEFPFVNEHGKEALNFQISMTLYAIIALILCLIFIGFFLLMAIGIVNLVLVIKASIETNKGKSYHYPLTFRFVK